MEAVGIWAGVVIQLCIGVYVYGRLTERVQGHGKRLDRLEGRVDNHAERISRLEG